MEYQISDEAIQRVTQRQYKMNEIEHMSNNPAQTYTPQPAALREKTPVYTMQDAAILLNIGPHKLFALLRIQGVINKNNLPYIKFEDAGLFKTITKSRRQKGIGCVPYKTTSVTNKGMVWLSNKLKQWELNHG